MYIWKYRGRLAGNRRIIQQAIYTETVYISQRSLHHFRPPDPWNKRSPSKDSFDRGSEDILSDLEALGYEPVSDAQREASRARTLDILKGRVRHIDSKHVSRKTWSMFSKECRLRPRQSGNLGLQAVDQQVLLDFGLISPSDGLLPTELYEKFWSRCPLESNMSCLNTDYTVVSRDDK